MAATHNKSSSTSSQETGNFLEKLYTLSGDLICIADIDGYFKKLNPAFEKCLGYSPGELLDRTFLEFVHPDDLEGTKAVIRNKLELGISLFNFENRYRCKDGTYKWLSWTSNPVVEEKMVYAIARDVTERKTAEQKIKDSEKQYQQLFEMESDAIFLIDVTNGRFLEANKAAAALYGYTHDELVTKCHIDLSAEPEETIRTVANPPKTIPLRYHRKKDGTIFPVEITTNHIVFDQRPCLLCAVRDITERMQIESAGKKSESKYRSLFSEMQSGFSLNEIICDDKGNPVDYVTVEVNQAFESLLGLTREAVLNQKVSNFLSKSELDHWLGIFGPVALTGKSASYEMYSPHNDKHFEGITYSPERGKFAVVFNDVTEQKKAEVELQQTHTDLEIAQRLTKIGSWKWTIATNKVTWSKGLCHILGWDPQKPPPPFNEEMSSFYSPDSWKKLNEAVAKALNTGEAYDIEMTEITTGGTAIVTNTRGEVDYGSDGKIAGLHGTVQDITERKQLQEQLFMQDRLASIGQLVSGVAHELNNPLTSVLGYSELLLEKELPKDISEDLTIVHHEAQRTSKIVKNLLTFARQQPREKRPVVINDPIQTVLQLRAHEHAVNNIRVNTQFAPDMPCIMANNSQLQQVCFNIIINAEFVMMESHHSGTMTIKTDRNNDFVRASFSDDGPGISREHMARLFTPFFTTKEVGKGTGLGLSICQGIVTEHGGRIWAESEPGHGATFIFELPAYKPKQTWSTEQK